MAGPTSAALELALTTDPLSSSPAWTDITSRLRGGTIRTAGRNRQLERADASAATFFLDNFDRALEPENAESAYYPNVVTGRRIRFRVTGPGRAPVAGFNRLLANYLRNSDASFVGVKWWLADSSGGEAVTLSASSGDTWPTGLNGSSYLQATLVTTAASRSVSARHANAPTFGSRVYTLADATCPCRQGDSIRLHAIVKVTAQTSACNGARLVAYWFDRNGTQLSSTTVQAQATPTTGTWYTLKGNVTAPANARMVALAVEITTGTTTGTYTYRWAACNLAPASAVATGWSREFYGANNPDGMSAAMESPGDLSTIGSRYLSDGVDVGRNGDQARRSKVEGDGRDPEGSVGFWPSTKNFVPNPGFQENAGKWTATGCALTRDTATYLFGVASGKIVTSNAASGEGIESDLIPAADLLLNQYHCASMWLKGTGTVRVYLWDSVAGKRYSAALTLGSSWQRLSVRALATTASTGLKIGVETNSQQAATFYVAGTQVEMQHVPTPYVSLFNSTYSPTYPARPGQTPVVPYGYIDTTQGWIAFYLRPAFASADIGLLSATVLLSWRDLSVDLDILSCRYTSSGWELQRANGFGDPTLWKADSWPDTDTKTLVVFAWTASKLRISVDGGSFSETNNAEIPTLPATAIAYFGSNQGGTPAYADIFWSMVGTGTLTDADVAALYARREFVDPGVLATTAAWKGLWTGEGAGEWIDAAGVTETLFDGFLATIKPEWEREYDSSLTLSCLDGTRILAQADMSADVASDTAGDQIDTLATQANWPEARRSIPAGYATVTAQTIGAAESFKILARMQDCADAEPGYVFFDRDGDLVFHDRYTRSRPPFDQVLATFGDGDAHLELAYEKPDPDYDDTQLYNEAKVLRDGGTTAQRVSDQASVDKYGRRSWPGGGGPKTAIVTTDQAAENLAANVVYRSHEATTRVNQFQVRPLDQVRLWAQVLQRGFGDRIEYVRRLAGGGSPIRRQGHIELAVHTFKDVFAEWSTVYALSPSGELSFWIAEDPVYGRAELTTRAGY